MARDASKPLRERLLDVCYASSADVNQVAQALISTLQILLIQIGPDADAAAKNIDLVHHDMKRSIYKDFEEYHSMVEAQSVPRH